MSCIEASGKSFEQRFQLNEVPGGKIRGENNSAPSWGNAGGEIVGRGGCPVTVPDHHSKPPLWFCQQARIRDLRFCQLRIRDDVSPFLQDQGHIEAQRRSLSFC